MIIKELFEGPVGDYCIARNTIKCLFDWGMAGVHFYRLVASKLRFMANNFSSSKLFCLKLWISQACLKTYLGIGFGTSP